MLENAYLTIKRASPNSTHSVFEILAIEFRLLVHGV